MGVGDEYVAHPPRSKGLLQRRNMLGHIRTGIDDGNLMPRTHDMDAGAPEGERSRIGRNQPRHQRRQLHHLACGHIERSVEIHAFPIEISRPNPGTSQASGDGVSRPQPFSNRFDEKIKGESSLIKKAVVIDTTAA